jgi:glutathione S-transferase
LHEKNLQFEDVWLNLGKKDQLKPEYLAINPNGVVPTLLDDGEPIVDSSVICEYLDEKYPDHSLTPSGVLERARMRSWMRYLEEVPTAAIRVPSFNRAFLSRFDGLDEKGFRKEQVNVRKIRKDFFMRMGSPKGFSSDQVTNSLQQLSAACERMHAALDRGPWLLGQQFTLADVLAAPTIDRMRDLDLAYLWEEKYPRVSEWYNRLQARPAFAATYYAGTRVSELTELRPLYASGR